MSERKKVVIDTNVLVSGIFWGGKPKQILDNWVENLYEVYISEEILKEYLEVIERVGKNPEITLSWRSFLLKNCHIIEVSNISEISRDKDDDKFIWCALASNADFIISGDEDLLVLKKHKNIIIIKPNKFLEYL